MDSERGVVWGVVGLIVVTTLVSGPLVGAVDFTTEPDHTGLGTGTATIDAVTLPDRATLTAGRFGAGEYTLRVPDATLELSAVEGRPILVYKLSIDSLGYTRSTTHFVSDRNVGRFPLSMTEDSFDPEAFDGEYEGRLEVILRANNESREIASKSIPVEVVE